MLDATYWHAGLCDHVAAAGLASRDMVAAMSFALWLIALAPVAMLVAALLFEAFDPFTDHGAAACLLVAAVWLVAVAWLIDSHLT